MRLCHALGAILHAGNICEPEVYSAKGCPSSSQNDKKSLALRHPTTLTFGRAFRYICEGRKKVFGEVLRQLGHEQACQFIPPGTTSGHFLLHLFTALPLFLHCIADVAELSSERKPRHTPRGLSVHNCALTKPLMAAIFDRCAAKRW